MLVLINNIRLATKIHAQFILKIGYELVMGTSQ